MTTHWPVMPLCDAQLRDVRAEDILYNGVFRKCDTYRGGGGYDRFPQLFKARYGETHHVQFVVQLRGCHLHCPYCYVTPAGINGEAIIFDTKTLVKRFVDSGLSIFHLMGGAPALYIDKWPELLDELFEAKPDAVFHSDLLLTERLYSVKTLKAIARERCLYAVSIKGVSWLNYANNTGVRGRTLQKHAWLMLHNMRRLTKLIPNRYYYYTFTNCDKVEGSIFKKLTGCPKNDDDSFNIDLVQYEALKEVN